MADRGQKRPAPADELSEGVERNIRQRTVARSEVLQQLLRENRGQEWFREFDRDGSGSLDKNELINAMLQTFMGSHNMTRPVITDIIHAVFPFVDRDGGGSVSFHEFKMLRNAVVAQMDSDTKNKAAAMTVMDARGIQVGITKHVQQGKTTITVTRAGVADSGKLRHLDLKQHIYLVKEGKFGRKMPKLAACLIMHPDDFWAIEQSVHAGAFGSDYEEIRLDLGSGQAERRMVLWKLAADLNSIKGYAVIPVPQDVGTYGMMDDWRNIKFANPIHIGQPVTKMRYDFQHGAEITSVHHMELESNPDIRFATMSSDKFFENFYEIQTHREEFVRAQTMMKNLESKANIKAFLCNSQQHQIVFYEDAKTGQLLTPVTFAAILNDCDGRAKVVKDSIREALATRGYGGKTFTAAQNAERFSTWVNDYIETFSSAVGVGSSASS